MIVEILKMAVLISGIAGVWLAIDLLWQRTFDVHTRQIGCGGCGCDSPCPPENRQESGGE